MQENNIEPTTNEQQYHNRHLCIYFIVFVTVLYWNTILIATVDKTPYYLTSYFDTCYLLNLQQYPQFSILRRDRPNLFSKTTQQITLDNCKANTVAGEWSLAHRPMVGDHIHLQMVLSVDNKVYNFHDRNMSQRIAYEVDNYPVTCPNPMTFSYEKRWYHTGVHTHCDGNIVHVHPWSAPYQLRVEGRDVKLKLWFESVGIEVATNHSALKLPGTEYYRSDWHMEYYTNVNDEHPAFVTTDIEEIANLWLVDHHGEIVLWSGGQKPEKDFTVLKYSSHPENYPKR